MTESLERTPSGAIIYDPLIIKEISDSRFSADGWLHAEPVRAALGAAGRGSTLYVGNVPRQFVMRHYMRGGLVGKLVRDSYVWTGEDNTRPFVEWRLLARLAGRGLRVPRPAAARYVRSGLYYRADLITVRIPGIRPLSACLLEKRWAADFWASVGAAIRDFHAAGVCHADMNAFNLQIDAAGDLWMLDLDRGRLLEPGPWQQKTLARLHRSLEKIKARDPRVNFAAENWDRLLGGYFDASRSA